MILRGNHIVLPTSLQNRAMVLAHEGHQGIVKTKKLLREKVWFPGIEARVKQLIGNCIACQANGPENYPEPLQMLTLQRHSILYMLISVDHFQQENTYWSR